MTVTVPPSTPSPLTPFNPFDPGLHADPHLYYRRYREHEPVHWGLPSFPGVPGSWYVTSYAEAAIALRDPRFIRELYRLLPAEVAQPLPEQYAPYLNSVRRSMQFRDPPEHTRLRRLIHTGFSPRVVATLRAPIEQISQALATDLRTQARFDLLEAYAFPLTVTVIAELLGISQNDRATLKRWAIDLIAAMDLRKNNLAAIFAAANRATVEAAAYIRALVAERRVSPRADLLSALVEAEQAGDQLTEEELVTNCTLLIMGGFETTVNLIGNGMWTLLRHQEQLQRLRDTPTLIESAIEELLRYEGPAQITGRFAAQDMDLGGRPIKRGDSVTIVYAAANRDPLQFPEPDTFDIGRMPNRHIGFGSGTHFCTGAPLARLEAQIAITTLLDVFPSLTLVTDPPVWNGSLAARGMHTLMVAP